MIRRVLAAGCGLATVPPKHPLSDVLEPVERLLHGLLALPVQASAAARRIDELQYVQFAWFSVLGAITFVAAGWFVLRYRRGRVTPAATPELRAPLWLEGGFALLLLASFVAFWVVGFRQYVEVTVAPHDAMEVYVTARQWVWKFAYADGPSSAGTLYVPVGRPVRLILTSRDVIHSFFVPALRLKQDAVPGRYTTAWFQADRAGRYQLLCAEYCGAGHSRMWGEVEVLGGDEYADWLAQRTPAQAAGPLRVTPLTEPQVGEAPAAAGESLARRGLVVAEAKGCLRCHTTDGTPHIGPSWLGLWGRRVELADGSTVTADAAYLTESMMDPMVRIVAGYGPFMPTYQGRLEPGETAALLALIRALDRPPADEEDGGAPPVPAAALGRAAAGRAPAPARPLPEVPGSAVGAPAAERPADEGGGR